MLGGSCAPNVGVTFRGGLLHRSKVSMQDVLDSFLASQDHAHDRLDCLTRRHHQGTNFVALVPAVADKLPQLGYSSFAGQMTLDSHREDPEKVALEMARPWAVGQPDAVERAFAA